MSVTSDIYRGPEISNGQFAILHSAQRLCGSNESGSKSGSGSGSSKLKCCSDAHESAIVGQRIGVDRVVSMRRQFGPSAKRYIYIYLYTFIYCV